uniref:Uncharacterized protein n=1 Tax=Physcomitrium patens TaxID=3218 RepID=A0A2K1K796_PHYPA|nr:hypothetical protein PHYPA_011542 [Physcomitrium patens]
MKDWGVQEKKDQIMGVVFESSVVSSCLSSRCGAPSVAFIVFLAVAEPFG